MLKLLTTTMVNMLGFVKVAHAPRSNPTGSVLSGTGTGNNEEVIVYGRVPSQTTPSPGTYTDTVQVTIAW